jgi:hypothetical protein
VELICLIDRPDTVYVVLLVYIGDDEALHILDAFKSLMQNDFRRGPAQAGYVAHEGNVALLQGIV